MDAPRRVFVFGGSRHSRGIRVDVGSISRVLDMLRSAQIRRAMFPHPSEMSCADKNCHCPSVEPSMRQQDGKNDVITRDYEFGDNREWLFGQT